MSQKEPITEEHPKAKFIWRKTVWLNTNALYTLMGWSDVKKLGDLPPEYTNRSGPKFWVMTDDHSVALEDIAVKSEVVGCYHNLERGNVLEQDEYDAVVTHLQAASKRLQRVNNILKDSSEEITLMI